MANSTASALDARRKALADLDASNVNKKLERKETGCVEKLMAAGKSRTEAEVQCEEHQMNVREMNKRDSLLGKIMSGMGKK